MYRYRITNSTSRCLKAVEKHLSKVGNVRYLKGYRYRSLRGIQEAVLVRGDKGSARFNGFLWGYGGEGPHGLRDLLVLVGVEQPSADIIAFRTTRRYPTLGEDWRLTKNGMFWELTTPHGAVSL